VFARKLGERLAQSARIAAVGEDLVLKLEQARIANRSTDAPGFIFAIVFSAASSAYSSRIGLSIG